MKIYQKTERISVDEIRSDLEDALTRVDALRTAGIAQLLRVRGIKTRGLEWEQKRRRNMGAEGGPRVLEIERRLGLNKPFAFCLKLETERARREPPSASETTWVLDGYLRDHRLGGVGGLRIALFDRDDQPLRALGSTTSEKDGYFKLIAVKGFPKLIKRKPTRGVVDGGRFPEAPSREDVPEVYLHIIRSKKQLYIHPQPVMPQRGRTDYVEVYLPGADSQVKGEPAKPGR